MFILHNSMFTNLFTDVNAENQKKSIFFQLLSIWRNWDIDLSICSICVEKAYALLLLLLSLLLLLMSMHFQMHFWLQIWFRFLLSCLSRNIDKFISEQKTSLFEHLLPNRASFYSIGSTVYWLMWTFNYIVYDN